MKRAKLSFGDKLAIWKKTDGHCWYCGCDLAEGRGQFDHQHPFSKGGICAVENMVLACLSCNQLKKGRTVEEFRDYLLDRIVDRMSAAALAAIKYEALFGREFVSETEGAMSKAMERIEEHRGSITFYGERAG